MSKWATIYLYRRLARIREIEASFGWTAGDRLDHGLIKQLHKEAREIEASLEQPKR